MEWSDDATLQFIEIYRANEILWNTKHPSYYNKMKKNDVWDEIAMEFHTTAEECKKKMNALRSALRRERAKIKKCQGTRKGRDDVYESGWYAFKSLLFLWDKNKVRSSQSTIREEKIDILDNDTSTETQAISKDILSSQIQSSTKFNIKSKYDERLDEVFQILSKASRVAEAHHEEDENQVFGQLVAKKLQKYSPDVQTAIQREIMNILFRADMGLYNETPS
ncbi:uncharacterized protein LOC128893649 [Hylaeus anthracinus]|uniref:uncharacterized protein LOC128893649 n=1 Tax=Hylaeus anthracinus TaxID=313031 RepID=UPI0023B9B055|nr:uncharacterized protein LOC128893649 [Hylaeus anthracinus]